jgi:hypothetical protein
VSALQAQVASWQQQYRASDILTSGRADGGILALAAPGWQGALTVNMFRQLATPAQRRKGCFLVNNLQKVTEPWDRGKTPIYAAGVNKSG